MLIFLNRGLYFITSFILIFLLLSTRNFGPDYQTYFDLFNEPSTAFEAFSTGSLEPFWPLFMVTIKNLFDKPSYGFTLIGLTSFIIRYISAKILFKSNILLSLSLWVYIFSDFFNRDLGQIRNGISSSILGLAISLYILNKRKGFFISSILSIITHYQSIIFLSILSLINKFNFSFFRLKIKNFIILALFILSIFFLLPQILNLLVQIPIISKLVLKVLIYMGDGYKSAKGVPYFIFLSAFFGIISFTNRKKYPNMEEKILNLQILPPILFLCFLSFPILSSRISSTFTGLNYIFYPIILYYFACRFNKYKKYIYIFSIIMSLILGFFSLFKYNQIYLIK